MLSRLTAAERYSIAVKRLVQRLLLWGVLRPAAAAALFILITIGLAAQIPRLQIDDSNEGFMLEQDPARQYYERVKTTFGSDELTVVMLKADDVFTTPALELLQRLSDALERIDGVTRVDSLVTVHNISGTEDGVEIAPLLQHGIPRDGAGLAAVKTKALHNPVFVGNLISADARAAGIFVYTQPAETDKAFNQRFSTSVEHLIARNQVPGVTVEQIGGPLIKATVADFVRRDQMTLIPFSAMTLFVVLMIGFRTPQGVVAPLFTGLSSAIWGVGLMALFHIPLNVVTVAVPSLVLVVGFAEAVHIISAYHACLRAGRDKIHALTEAVEEAALPVLVTTATTILGFATLIFSDITILIQFGYAATLALTANFISTLIGIPLLLRLWPRPKRIKAGAADEFDAGHVDRRIAAACDFVLRHRIPIGATFAALAVASIWGWYTLKVDTDFVSYFPRNSTVRQRMRDVDQSLNGGSAFFVVVETGRDNGVADPSVLNQIAELQTFLEGVPGIGKTTSIVDYVSQLNATLSGVVGRDRAVPASADVVAQGSAADGSRPDRPLPRPAGFVGQHRRSPQPDGVMGAVTSASAAGRIRQPARSWTRGPCRRPVGADESRRRLHGDQRSHQFCVHSRDHRPHSFRVVHVDQGRTAVARPERHSCDLQLRTDGAARHSAQHRNRDGGDDCDRHRGR